MAVEDITGVNRHLAELKMATKIVDDVFEEIRDELHDDLDKVLIKFKTRIKVDLMEKLGDYKFENN